MAELKGSKTEANLLAAFAGESQARNKYTFFASQARKDGYEEIAAIFEDTAANERAHAKIWYNMLHGGVASTQENLQHAAEGEWFEHAEMYPEFAEVAKTEGFDRIAALFLAVAEVERAHEARYRLKLDEVRTGRVFARDARVTWVCRNCGHEHVGPSAPDVCPVCSHPKAFFEEKK